MTTTRQNSRCTCSTESRHGRTSSAMAEDATDPVSQSANQTDRTERVEDEETSKKKMTILDSDGDLEVKCFDQATQATTSFLVSSKILQLASPVFRCMFKPQYKEGQQLLQADRPAVVLEGDDAPLMETIFKILHHGSDIRTTNVDPRTLVRLAIISDKYDLTETLRVWSAFWFRLIPDNDATSEELGFLLLASWLFKDMQKFKNVFALAVWKLPLGFEKKWAKEELLDIIPEHLTMVMNREIKQTLNDLEMLLQTTPAFLRQGTGAWETQMMACSGCSRIHPAAAKTCHPCNNNHLQKKLCNTDSRLVEFFLALEAQSLWPMVQQFDICSPIQIANLIAKLNFDKHVCGASRACPLQTCLDTIKSRMSIARDNIRSRFCLQCIKEGGSGDDGQCCTHKQT
ncbi:unnamed protein product [Periconia digitata]|uniref:BTB domain-containing protein n=1 Tax=Periconia digitata TaxID=1303443 RepID=A0A9W4XI89_9PLEO|nr:unnamed protein product [Periconia digitata]